MLAGNTKHFKVKAEQAVFEMILAKSRKILQAKLQRRLQGGLLFLKISLMQG
jgi:hypothetical protein